MSRRRRLPGSDRVAHHRGHFPGSCGPAAKVRTVRTDTQLPLIDEHFRMIEADLPAAWTALVAMLDSSRQSGRRAWGARVLGCSEASSNRLPLTEPGATTPGFRVVEAIPLSRLALRGRHRFSEYLLEFELEPASPASTSVVARTRAAFPGRRGWLYRQLVIGSRAHVAAVNSMLAAVGRRAERDADSRRPSAG